MPQAFENFFFKLRRKPQQTLLEYSAEFQQTLREITKHKVQIPDAVAGWMMLRRSGLSKDQEHLIQTQVGADLTSGNVERAMYLILGQDYRGMQQPGHLRKGQPTPQRWKRSAIHNVWDEDAPRTMSPMRQQKMTSHMHSGMTLMSKTLNGTMVHTTSPRISLRCPKSTEILFQLMRRRPSTQMSLTWCIQPTWMPRTA